MSYAEDILPFLFNLQLPFSLPGGAGVLDVHKHADVRDACTQFYYKYYGNTLPRRIIMGINPGRFGGGVTGIPFTDPIRLQQVCAIDNGFQKKQELSSVFVYDVIQAYGGPVDFYNAFYITSISPLGFVKNGKNLNYYDDAELKKTVEPFAVDCINKQLAWGLKTDVCYCLGEGENLKYLLQLNARYKWFGAVKGLPHPRFVMQYKLKYKADYIGKYLQALQGAGL